MGILILSIVVGFVCLILGANWLINGATAIARKYKVSDLIIGLTIVAFGTSAPELVVNSIASSSGLSDIVLGNIIGSNNFNLFVILGVSGLIYPIQVQSSTAWKEIPISITITVILFLLLNDFSFAGNYSSLSRINSIIMLCLFVLFIIYLFSQMKKEQDLIPNTVTISTGKSWLKLILGFAGLLVGGHLVVTYSVELATYLGMSEKIIGLTIVAAGTSLPELVTSVVAALKRNSDIAIGNVIGSNIFNILLILSISGLISPIAYNCKFNAEILLLLIGSVLLLVTMYTGKRKKLDRWEATLLLLTFIGYTVYVIINEI